MKTAFLPLVCICVCAWSQGSAAVEPLEKGASRIPRPRITTNAGPTREPQFQEPQTVPARQPARVATPAPRPLVPASGNPISQRAAWSENRPTKPPRAGLPPIQTQFHSSEESTIVRPWEVADEPVRGMENTPRADAAIYSTGSSDGQLQTSSRVRIAPTADPAENEVSSVRTADLHDSANAPATEERVEAWYENSLRQHSPAPASKLASPASPSRPAPRAGRALVGSQDEYAQRDGHTFSVHGSAGFYQKTPQQSNTPARHFQPTPGSKPALPSASESQQRVPVKVIPATQGARLQPTAPSRWIRPNPLRDSELADESMLVAESNEPAESYIQQTSAVSVAQAPAAAGSEDRIPSLTEELPLPFDPNEANEAANSKKSASQGGDEPLQLPFGPEDAPSATKPTAQAPAASNQANPAEQPLNLDDLPFDLPNEKSPTDTTKQPSTTPPATEKPESAVPAEQPNPNPPSDFPFSLENEAEEKMPPDVSPADTAPGEEDPLDSTGLDSPPPPIPAPEKPEQLKSINAISASIVPPSGELPASRAVVENEDAAIYYGYGNASRGWSVSSYHWEATAMCHQPLYFEEVNLERYGYSRGALQPAFSYAQFMVNVIAMPYKAIAEPSREAVYTLGHYRPGSYAPYRVQYPPVSAAGSMFEAGVILGLVFVIP